MSASTMTPRARSARSDAAPVRRYELDWLRTIAVFGLIPFHAAIIFTTGSYDYVKNAQSSAVMDYLTSFISIWGIPLLFLVAGGASRFALVSRSVSQYLNERVTRLLIPFTFGMLLIVPLQVYIGRLTEPAPPNFAVFYLGFMQTLLGVFTGHFPRGPEWIGHLWFIPPLMLFSALALPFAWLLRTAKGEQAQRWLTGALHGYGVLALFGLPLVAVQYLALIGAALVPAGNATFTGNAIGVVAFLIFFLYGYLLYLDERFIASIRRDVWVALALGAASWILLAFVIPRWSSLAASPLLAYPLLALLRGYCAWWWVIGILGLALRFLQFTTPAVAYLTRAAYPVYIIHMPILSLIAFWVVQMNLDIALKFGLIVVASLLASLGAYDALIRRVAVMRLLFGLRSDGHGPRSPYSTPPRSPNSPHSLLQRFTAVWRRAPPATLLPANRTGQ